MASVKVDCVVKARALIGEGPVWEESERSLLFVDIYGRKIHRWHPDTDRTQSMETGNMVGFAVPRRSGGYVAGIGRSIVAVDWSTRTTTSMAEVDEDKGNTRLNDGKVDPYGRLFAGTMAIEERPAELERHQGSLYSVTSDLTVTKHLDKVTPVCHLCGPCLSPVWSLSVTCVDPVCHLCGPCLSPVWTLSVTCVEPVCHLCGACLSPVWTLSVTCVDPVCHLCGPCLSPVWSLSVTCVEPVCHLCGPCLSPVCSLSVACVEPVCRLCGACLSPVWSLSVTGVEPVCRLCGACLSPVCSLSVACVEPVCHLCGACLSPVWSLSVACVEPVCHLCAACLSPVWSLLDFLPQPLFPSAPK
uniref:Regucalcin n=1 Tax=Takifugu rubripes TaxID=31033 RepID=A0A674MRN5_TAKRU